MKYEFVTYELALRMKQLGFNEHCFGVYDDDDDNTFYEIRSSYSIGFSKNIEGRVLAPTWQSAFRWFREKYNLWSCIQKYPTSENPNRCYYELKGDKINTDKDESPNSYMSGWFNSYEEAELACLEKLIEIVEGCE